jgi:hypothetical protein
MLDFLAQAGPRPFFVFDPGDSRLIFAILGVLVVGFAFMFLLMQTPSNLRRYVVGFFCFLGGSFYVAEFLWPKPLGADTATEIPANAVEQVGFVLANSLQDVGRIANAVAALLIGLGIMSILRVHTNRIRRRTENWQFSIVLLTSAVVMAVIGFSDWYVRTFNDPDGRLNESANWLFVNRANDFLFEGIYQQMDAAMFSMIAFFILSAAYRAFRIRSVEATVMMASALILMLNLMGGLSFAWGTVIDNAVNGGAPHFLLNFKLTEIAGWLRNNMQVPAIRAIEFGVGIGALAMGLRIWLGIEKGGTLG